MRCGVCGTDNRPEARFCRTCGSPLALTCPNGHPVEPGDRFCDICGAAVGPATDAPDQPRPAPVAERRLVTVLFADLVGFTPLSESRDPEEVREILSGYFERTRAAIERHGGVVEKFIGDAVMAVWGSPVAHEDDAERAVRAGFSLVDTVGQLNDALALPPDTLSVRVGLMTGEAAVTVGATGQGMVAGDLVNTASRIQAAAPAGAVLVADGTRHASDASIAYEAMEPLELKGKSEPVSVWRALRVVAGRGGVRRADVLEPPWVGRDLELRLVKDLFHACIEQRRSHLVAVTGIAGIGKSRLSWEFEKYVDGIAERVLWHRGRSLAYGDGVTYWALAEMVRMRAAIQEEEDAETALAKLKQEVARWVTDDDLRDWVERSLGHLVGLDAGPPPVGEELFAAWRVFFERMAEQRPVVLVFEDLHWADPSLLDFLEHLLTWSTQFPIFLLIMARPELAERRPGWPTGKKAATALHLEPLPDEAMARLIEGMVPGIPDDTAARIRERAEGVPLYAVETVRMLVDRGVLAPTDEGVFRIESAVGELDVPATLHALIAARLDGLPADERRLIGDASILGKTFTVRGLQALTGRPADELEPLLRSLLAKELLYVQSDPRSPERGQYGFLQSLVREVTYGTLSKRDRKSLHLAAAGYLESDRLADEEEIVEVVASHYLDAFAADPSADDAQEIRARARDLLVRAGERAASLAAPAQAAGHFEHALRLADDPLQQASLQERAGEEAWSSGDLVRGRAHLEQAIELFESAGREGDAARASARLADVLWDQGHIGEGLARMERSFEVLSTREPDVNLATLAAQLARLYFFTGDVDRAEERIDFALPIAERLYAAEVLSHALNTKSLVFFVRGRPEEARALLHHALVIAREHGASGAILRSYYNLFLDPLDAVLDYCRLGLELARRLGRAGWEINFLGRLAQVQWLRGEWDAAEETAQALVDPVTWSTSAVLSRALPALTHLHVHRGELEEAETLVSHRAGNLATAGLLERGDYFAALAFVAHAKGDLDEALRVSDEVIAIAERMGSFHETTREGVPEAVAIRLDAGKLDEAQELIDRFLGRIVPDRDYLAPQLARFQARLAAARGEEGAEEQFRRAVTLAQGSGIPFLHAVSQVDFATWLIERGRRDEAGPFLAGARDILERLRAKPWLDRIASMESAGLPAGAI